MSHELSRDVDEAKPLRGQNPSVIALDVETVRRQMSSIVQRLGQRATFETLRPLHVFLGVSAPSLCVSTGAFNPPVRQVDKSLVEKVQIRFVTNIGFFLTNYVVVATGVAVVVSLLNPGMLLVCSVVWGLWWVHEYLIYNEVTIFGNNIGTILSISQRSTVLSVVTIFTIVWKCLLPFLSFVAVSGFLIVLHALLRDPKHVNGAEGIHGYSDDESSDAEQVFVDRGDII
mmetsp:Transcript_7671/g.13268  ORF Transcript_7671/g.13268 Transcript_7671/m.13268 type:complete len:229 (-) Transcript_7671:127-813(-)|eukprot:CAMPEP_0116567594 /NCGR_PEP_ID=MMETSP0397-20121206/15095_1 /TAXON_ID=216820 /ORGANISM="Cyclophora tenuis, Strain ECT3854" /LENGTH=228 /DNA_ID=CAMNT_0004094605 /DNA_START=92 /DNA_END=778 /DNA_ORIENTATION=-